jgi:hypothetical protein
MLQSLIGRFRRREQASPAQLTLLLGGAPRTADELMARLAALGLRRLTTCRLTRNRKVMVSFGGTELRVHSGYLHAPDEILAAIVMFVEGRTRAQRLHARRQLLAFPIETPGAKRRASATHADDLATAARLP